MNRLTTCFLIAISCTRINVSQTQAQENHDKNTIDLEIPLRASGTTESPMLRGVQNLGVLKANTEYTINLNLFNNTQRDFHFNQAESGCRCRTIEIAGTSFPVKRNAIGKLVFKTPQNSPSNEFFTGVEFKENRRVVCVVSLSGKLAGNLSLKSNELLIQHPDRTSKHDVEFVYSEPLTLEQLSVKSDDTLGPFLTAKLIPSSNQGIGILRVETKSHAPKNPGRPIVGDITLLDPTSKIETTLSVILQQHVPIKISPNFLDFIKSDESEGMCQASAILKISKTDFPEPASVKIKCSLNGTHCLVESRELSQHIFRLTVAIPEKAIQQIHEQKNQPTGVDGKSLIFRLNVDGKMFAVTGKWSYQP